MDLAGLILTNFNHMDITLNILYEESQTVQMGAHTRKVKREFTLRHTIERDDVAQLRDRLDKKGVNRKSCVVMMDDGRELIVNEPFESVYQKIYGRGKIGY